MRIQYLTGSLPIQILRACASNPLLPGIQTSNYIYIYLLPKAWIFEVIFEWPKCSGSPIYLEAPSFADRAP